MDFEALGKTETATSLFARQGIEGLGTLDLGPLEDDLRGGDVVELQGGEGSGKTELLYKALAAAVLPGQWLGVRLGGCAMAACFLDTDNRFSVARFVAVLEARIAERLPADFDPAPGALNDLVQASLARLYVARCFEVSSLVACLHLALRMAEADPRLRVVAVDSLSAFHWQEKHVAGKASQGTATARVCQLLRELRDVHKAVILATVATIFATKPRAGAAARAPPYPPELEQNGYFASKEWGPMVTRRLVAARFPPQTPTSSTPQRLVRLAKPARSHFHAFAVRDGGLAWGP